MSPDFWLTPTPQHFSTQNPKGGVYHKEFPPRTNGLLRLGRLLRLLRLGLVQNIAFVALPVTRFWVTLKTKNLKGNHAFGGFPIWRSHPFGQRNAPSTPPARHRCGHRIKSEFSLPLNFFVDVSSFCGVSGCASIIASLFSFRFR